MNVKELILSQPAADIAAALLNSLRTYQMLEKYVKKQ